MGEGDAFLLDQLEQHRRLVAARIDLLDAGERRRPGKAPGVDVKHRRDRHVHVVAAKPPLHSRDAEKRQLGQRMKYELPMAVIDALGETGRTGRIKRRRLRILVEVGEVVVGRSRGEKRLIFADERQIARSRRGLIGHHDHSLDVCQFRLEAFHQPREFVIDDQGRALGVVDRVGDLFRRQPDIDRLQHHSHHRNGEKRFEKPVAVPIENADGVARANSNAMQGRSEAADALPDVAIGEALKIPIDDLLIRSLDDRRVPQLFEDQRILIS